MEKNYMYLLRCADGSLYCGWTNHLEERVRPIMMAGEPNIQNPDVRWRWLTMRNLPQRRSHAERVGGEAAFQGTEAEVNCGRRPVCTDGRRQRQRRKTRDELSNLISLLFLVIIV